MPSKVINAWRKSDPLGLWHGGEKGPGGGSVPMGHEPSQDYRPPPRDPKFPAIMGGAEGRVSTTTRARSLVIAPCDRTTAMVRGEGLGTATGPTTRRCRGTKDLKVRSSGRDESWAPNAPQIVIFFFLN